VKECLPDPLAAHHYVPRAPVAAGTLDRCL
jgi:hypothetical protein